LNGLIPSTSFQQFFNDELYFLELSLLNKPDEFFKEISNSQKKDINKKLNEFFKGITELGRKDIIHKFDEFIKGISDFQRKAILDKLNEFYKRINDSNDKDNSKKSDGHSKEITDLQRKFLILTIFLNQQNNETNNLQNIISSLDNPDQLINQGMNIVILFRTDKQKLQECFQLFKQFSDEFNDPKASAKVSACYYRGIGIKKIKIKVLNMLKNQKNKDKLKEYFGMP
jgi:hypothetical protein